MRRKKEKMGENESRAWNPSSFVDRAKTRAKNSQIERERDRERERWTKIGQCVWPL